MKIAIIGYGVIGKLEYETLNKCNSFNITIIDPLKNLGSHCKADTYDLAVICVPTPDKDGLCDISIVEQIIAEYNAKLFLIKSTVIPGTTDYLKEKYGRHIVMSPEHSGATQHCNNFEYNSTTLGGDLEDTTAIQQIYQHVFDARHRFIHVNAKTAEMSKYMLNSFLAMKVTFCNEFAKFCTEEGISYEQVRECFLQDPRINPSHTFVYNETPFWNSHCFNKDIPAIANKYNSELLKTIISINDKAKNNSNNC